VIVCDQDAHVDEYTDRRECCPIAPRGMQLSA
jgi:hypothetical protein